MKVFLKSPNWIGDCVMSLPAIRALKDSSPEIQIFLITKPNLSQIYKNVTEIEKIVVIPSGAGIKGFFNTLKILRGFGIKEGILLTNSFISAITLKLSGVKNLTGYKRDLRGWLLTNKEKFPGKSIHQVEFYINIIKLFLKKKISSDYSNELIIDNRETKRAKDIISSQGWEKGELLIGISPTAAFGEAKEWGDGKFKELIKRISEKQWKNRVVLFGSSRENERINGISSNSIKKPIVVTGEYSLREAISVISLCNVFIGNDSGLLHVANGLNVPLIGLFGPTSPKTTSPVKGSSHIIYKNVDCSPCSYRNCPIDHKCMNEISVEEVMEIVNKLIL